MEIRVGTASWSDPELVKSGWYPKEARRDSEARLRYYASQFDTVEVDSSYYALPKKENVARWAERVPEGFIFHVKAYSAFTGHGLEAKALPPELRAWTDAPGRIPQAAVPAGLIEAAWEMFQEALLPLREAGKLGYLLFQLPPWIHASPRAWSYLAELRRRTPGQMVAIEFRHPSWYSDWPGTRDLLAEHDFIHVAVDGPPLPEVPPRILEATGPMAILRCHGRNTLSWRGPHQSAAERFDWSYSPEEIADLGSAAQELARQEPTYVIFNNNHGDQAQRNAAQILALLRSP